MKGSVKAARPRKACVVLAVLLAGCGESGSESAHAGTASTGTGSGGRSGAAGSGGSSVTESGGNAGAGGTTSWDGGPADGSRPPDSASADANGLLCGRPTDGRWPSSFDAGAKSLPGITELPQIINLGGKVLHHPTFVPISFPGEPLVAKLDDFVATLGCTDYWRTVGGDYGVGEASSTPPVHLGEKAPAAIDAGSIRSWLVQKIDGKDPLFPRPSDETVYVLFYPFGTTITQKGETSCIEFGGFHDAAKLADGTSIYYAVVPHCLNVEPDVDLAVMTETTSHEMIEAATEPDPTSTLTGAWGQTDDNHFAHVFFRGGEVADLCELNGDAKSYRVPNLPYSVQRIWSNSAAAEGRNPCVPADTPNYFYAAPVLPHTVQIDHGGPRTIPVVRLPLNQTVTIPVKLIGHGVTGTMTVIPVDANYYLNTSTTRIEMHFGDPMIPDGTGQIGDTLQLTMKKVGTSPNGFTGFLLAAQMRSGDIITEHYFMALTAD